MEKAIKQLKDQANKVKTMERVLVESALKDELVFLDEGQTVEDYMDNIGNMWFDSNKPENSDAEVKTYRDIVFSNIVNYVSNNKSFQQGKVNEFHIQPYVEDALFFNKSKYALTRDNVRIISKEIYNNIDLDNIISDKVNGYIDSMSDDREDLLIDPIRFDKKK